jgi:hypothetical protein
MRVLPMRGLRGSCFPPKGSDPLNHFNRPFACPEQRAFLGAEALAEVGASALILSLNCKGPPQSRRPFLYRVYMSIYDRSQPPAAVVE